jgi:5-amino-6-(5-phospho-D-ribitylamino)uracil phosphatase
MCSVFGLEYISSQEPAVLEGNQKMYVICVDMDGTLLNKQGNLHAKDIEILRKPARYPIIPSTGRPVRSMFRAFKRNQLWLDELIPLPMVLDNGCVLYCPSGKLVRFTSFLPDVMDELMQLMRQHPHLTFALNTLEQTYVLWPPSALANELFRRFDFDAVPFLEGQDGQYTKVTVVAEDPRLLQDFTNLASLLPLDLTSSMPEICEILPQGRHKAAGIRELLAEMGMSDAFVCAAGDSANDLEMFDLAGRRFAPLNSLPEILERADQIIDVEKTGILAPILEWIQENG